MSGLMWWHWTRATRRLEHWVRTLTGHRPYTIVFKTGEGSYVDFRTRTIVIQPDFPDHLAPKAVHVPTRWGTSRVVRKSTLQVLCARALAYHEGGHVLFTDVVDLAGTTHAWLTNALEDERMERLTAVYYPPAGRDFHELGRRMWLHGMQPALDRATALLNACLFHRWDHERAPGDSSRLIIPLTDLALWREQIQPLVEEAWQAPQTQRVAELAREILAHIGLPPTDPAEHRPDLQRGQPSLDGSTRGVRLFDDLPMQPDRLFVPGDRDDAKHWQAFDDPDIDDVSLASPMADVDPSGGSLWMQPYQALQQAVIGEVRRLTQELVVVTPDCDPIPNATRGRFDVRACVRSHGTTPVVREVEDADDPSGLAIVLLIDGTGSMGGNPDGVARDGGPLDPHAFNHPDHRMPYVRKAVLAFQRACATLSVPLAIGVACDDIIPSHQRRGRYRVTDPVAWIQRWDTPVNAEGPRALIAGLYGNAQAEAMSRSLSIAQRELARRTEPVKLIIYVHDGQPTDESRADVRTTVERLRRHGTIVIGLFLGLQADLALMQEIFGVQWTIGTDDLSSLPVRLGRILKRFRTGR